MSMHSNMTDSGQLHTSWLRALWLLQVEVGGVLPKAVQAVQDAKVERKLGSAMHMSMHSNMTDSARIGAQLFGIPQARKGLVGGVCVIAVLCVGLVLMLRGYSTGKKGRRRRLQSV